jgi:hypothetical protein
MLMFKAECYLDALILEERDLWLRQFFGGVEEKDGSAVEGRR